MTPSMSTRGLFAIEKTISQSLDAVMPSTRSGGGFWLSSRGPRSFAAELGRRDEAGMRRKGFGEILCVPRTEEV